MIGKCVIKDDMQELYAEFIKSEMVVFATPIYWWGVFSQLKTFLDRLNAFDVKERIRIPKPLWYMDSFFYFHSISGTYSMLILLLV